MKIHRFIGDFDLTGQEVGIIDPENIKQIKAVLRLEVGDILELCDGKGAEAKVEIFEMSKAKINCKIVERKSAEKTKREVHLYLAILKKENFELAVQKAVECGVSEIIPVITERTVKVGLNMERLEKIMREASEQSGRSTLPKLFETMNFVEALEHGKENQEKVIYTPSLASDGVNLGGKDYTQGGGVASALRSVSIFVGPEGGFTEGEVNLAEKSGYTVASLGPLTLRGETAAIVATYRAVNGI